MGSHNVHGSKTKLAWTHRISMDPLEAFLLVSVVKLPGGWFPSQGAT